MTQVSCLPLCDPQAALAGSSREIDGKEGDRTTIFNVDYCRSSIFGLLSSLLTSKTNTQKLAHANSSPSPFYLGSHPSHSVGGVPSNAWQPPPLHTTISLTHARALAHSLTLVLAHNISSLHQPPFFKRRSPELTVTVSLFEDTSLSRYG